jgi:Domain of Unknown Function (DUF1080)
MRRNLLCLSLVCAAVGSTAVFALTQFTEDFSAIAPGTCYFDGQTFGSWLSAYNGYGCNSVVSSGGNQMLSERPLASTSSGETHAGLVLGPAVSGDMTYQVDALTGQQLRTGSSPNPWEVAWVLWNYTDDTHFYYFTPKPNGWELGKEDPAYPGAQRYLATGSSPAFPIGQWYQVKIAQSGSTIQVFVNGLLIVTFTDSETPYSSGQIGLYTEDAQAYFDNVSVTAGATLVTSGSTTSTKRHHR